MTKLYLTPDEIGEHTRAEVVNCHTKTSVAKLSGFFAVTFG